MTIRTTRIALPPYDPELAAVLPMMRELLPNLAVEGIQHGREKMAQGMPAVDLSMGATVRVQTRVIPGPTGQPDITVMILSPATGTGPWPAFYHIHGGGMIIGDMTMGLDLLAPLVAEHGAVAVSVEYRLAPEHPDPAPVEDCYAGLSWTARHADELGIDPERISIIGSSAGGGLAAGTALLARDRGFPALSHQILICPMLDDRFVTGSSTMLDGDGTWDRNDNTTGWTALLGERRGGAEVSIYAAPSRAQDLSGLPRTYIDCGSSETFRDETIDYAQRLSEAGYRSICTCGAEAFTDSTCWHHRQRFPRPPSEPGTSSCCGPSPHSQEVALRRLISRLALTDDDAANALRVITYFDALVDGHASVAAFVRGAATLANCTAGYEDRSRGTHLRFDPNGRPVLEDRSRTLPAASAWVEEQVGAQVWLEREQAPTPTDAMILERWAAGMRLTLDRTLDRGRLEMAVRLALDHNAEPDQRTRAVQRLQVPTISCVLAALPIDPHEQRFPARLRARIGHVTGVIMPADSAISPAKPPTTPLPPGWRIGIGTPVHATDLPCSWSEAVAALRLTADGSTGEPGETTIAYCDLGGLAVLAETVTSRTANIPDVQALSRALTAHPWTLKTLDALVRHASLRQAAQELRIHHSTLQERVTILRRDLGFAPETPGGRDRTVLALALRRLHRSGDMP